VLRYGADALAGGDEERLLRLLRFTTLVEIAGGIAAVGSAAILGRLAGAKLGWSGEAVAFALPFAFATLASIRSVPAAYLQLADRYDLIAVHATFQPIVRTMGAAVAALLHAGLKGFLVAWLLAALVEWAGMWIMAFAIAGRSLGLRRLWGSPRGVLAENQRLLLFMIGANADVTFGDLAGRLVPLVIGWWSGPTPAALFNVAQRATVVIAQPAELLGRTAYAEFATLVASGDRSGLRRVLVRATLIALAAACPLVLLVAVAGRPIAELLGGGRFAGAAPLMTWLVGAQALLLIAPPASAALVALGRPGLSLLANATSRLALLPLLPLLLAWQGLTGAGIQAILVAVVTATVLLWLVTRLLGAAHEP
jgi:O-antigen/teichoic acid export membrane protein